MAHGKVFVDVGVSLDGFLAGTDRGPHNPLGTRGPEIHQWMFLQESFRRHLHIGESGDTGPDNEAVESTFRRIGANVMGKRMFDEGAANWPEEAPFGTPVYVLTHEQRAPWPRPGGTTFHFVNDGIESALRQAHDAARGKDVRISGGADVIRQYLVAGLVDELAIHVSPVLLGDGLRLFDGPALQHVTLRQAAAEGGQNVTHLRYDVTTR